MARRVEEILRGVESEYKDQRYMRTVARIRGEMWTAVARGEFPEDISGVEAPPRIYVHPLFTFFPEDSFMQIDGSKVRLTLNENKLLDALSKQPNRTLTRPHLVNSIWGAEAFGADDHAVNIYIHKLREKIDNGRRIDSPIEAVRGIGYVLSDSSRVSSPT